MGFWNKLTQVGEKLGVVETVEVSEEEEATPATPSKPATAAAVTASKPAAVDQAKLTELDQAAKKQLGEAMQKAGAALVEELSDLLDSLTDAIPDEKSRYTAALKILIKKGNPIGAILQDFDKCIGALEEDDRVFVGQLKAQFDKRVGSRTQAVADYDSQIATKQGQIQKLTDEIAEIVLQRDDAQKSITEEQTKLNQVQERFEMAYRALRSEVEAQRAKITQYGESL